MAGVLLATATIASSYIVQPAKAVSNNNNFGNTASNQATGSDQNFRNPANGNGLLANSVNHNPDFGGIVSGCATGATSPTHCH